MADLGIELELSVLLGTMVLGSQIFSPFEVETPAWRRILKLTLVIALTLVLYRWVGHWAVLVPLVLGGGGLAFHWIWCRRNEIDPWTATPRRRYYTLRGWTWPEE